MSLFNANIGLSLTQDNFANNLVSAFSKVENLLPGIDVIDEFGNLINKAKKEEDENGCVSAEMKNITLKALEIKVDSFQREQDSNVHVEDKESHSAKIKTKEIKDGYKEFSELADNSNTKLFKEMAKDGQVSVTDKIKIDSFFKKLTSADTNNSTIIESTKEFLSKVDDMVEKLKSFKENSKSDDKETSFSFDTQDDIIRKKNPINIGNDFENNAFSFENPFFKSATKTTDEDVKKIAVD